jgi:MFS family permease
MSPVAQVQRSANHRRESVSREVWVLTSVSMMVMLGYGVVSPVLPQYANDFGVSIGAVAVATIAFSFARLCFAPVAGLAVQRLGEWPVYISALVAVSFFTCACAFAQTYWQLLLFRVLTGIGAIMFSVSSLGLAIRVSPPDMRGRISGMIAGGFSVGTICGPVLGSLMASLGLRAPFLIYGAALMFATIVVFHCLRRSAVEVPSAVASPKVSVRYALPNRAYRAALLSNFAIGWSVIGARNVLLPLFVYEVLDRGVGFAGLALTTYAVGKICGIFPSGYLSDRLGRRALLIGGLLVSGVTTMLASAATSPPVFLAATYVAGAAVGAFTAPQQAAVADVLGSNARAGTAVAMYQMVSDLGAVVGALVVGQVVQHLTFGWGFVVSGTVLLVGAVGWMLAPETGVAIDQALPAAVRSRTAGKR